MVSLIDTHNHLDAPSFDADRELLVREAKDAGVIDALICSGIPGTWKKTRAVAHQVAWHYALGVHPLYINEVSDSDALLRDLTGRIEALLSDNLFAAVGEIGLDGFVPGLNAEKMLTLFRGQLEIAAHFDLPVSVHARHCVDTVSRELARHRSTGGVVHAFNGSVEQAKRLVGLGMKLGFGGALTYTGSRRIRRVFTELSDTDFVLETDAPDMPGALRRTEKDTRTHVSDITRVLECAATLRGTDSETVAYLATQNALEAFPRMCLGKTHSVAF